MKQLTLSLSKLDLLFSSLFFIRKHFKILVGLGLIAAFGRVVQLGGFGEIPTWANIVLEVIVEGSRILLFLFVLGMANIGKGIDLVRRLFSGKSNLAARWHIAAKKLKGDWLRIALSFIGFFNYCRIVQFID